MKECKNKTNVTIKSWMYVCMYLSIYLSIYIYFFWYTDLLMYDYLCIPYTYIYIFMYISYEWYTIICRSTWNTWKGDITTRIDASEEIPEFDPFPATFWPCSQERQSPLHPNSRPNRCQSEQKVAELRCLPYGIPMGKLRFEKSTLYGNTVK